MSSSSMTSRTLSIPRQGGFTLLEVLIAIIILAMGLLGLAKLQTVGLTANNLAYQRSQASILAYEGVDMVYADREFAQNGCYDVTLEEDEPSAGGCGESPNVDLVKDWKRRLDHTLPGGKGSITVTETKHGKDKTQTYIVHIRVEWQRWTEEDGWNADSAKPLEVEVTTGI